MELVPNTLIKLINTCWLIYDLCARQVYISRGSIDTFSLVSDAQYISASLARIMRALFEICLRKGWSEMTLFMLEYCKAVDRQVWPHQHPFRQFDREISPQVCPSYLYPITYSRCSSVFEKKEGINASICSDNPKS